MQKSQEELRIVTLNPSETNSSLSKIAKKPTGDPRCPANVKRAKGIQREIDNDVGATTGMSSKIYSDEAGEVRSDEEQVGEDQSDEEQTNIGEEQSEVEGEQFSPVLNRQDLDANSQDCKIVQETFQPIYPVVNDSFFGGTDVSDAQVVDADSPGQDSPPKSKVLESIPKSQNKLQNARTPNATKSKPPAGGRIPLRLGVGDDQLKLIVQEVLHGESRDEGKKTKPHKRPKGIPENPNHSKKVSLAREIKDVNDEFMREKQEQNLKFETAKLEQNFRHIQEMERIKCEREIAERKYEAEMTARREDRALEAARHNQTMTMQMNFFAALLGGRGIAPLVQPSSLSSDSAPNNSRTP